MEKQLEMLADSMAFENEIDTELAAKVVTWLDIEGLVDYAILKETYGEPA